jgi:hypothetical protein
VDSASVSVGEEELRGVSVHVELVVGGNDFKSVVNDVLAEDWGTRSLRWRCGTNQIQGGCLALGCQVLGFGPLCGPRLSGLGQGLGWTHHPSLPLWLVSGRRRVWGVAFPPIGLLPATEAGAGSRLGVVQVEQVPHRFE